MLVNGCNPDFGKLPTILAITCIVMKSVNKSALHRIFQLLTACSTPASRVAASFLVFFFHSFRIWSAFNEDTFGMQTTSMAVHTINATLACRICYSLQQQEMTCLAQGSLVHMWCACH